MIPADAGLLTAVRRDDLHAGSNLLSFSLSNMRYYDMCREGGEEKPRQANSPKLRSMYSEGQDSFLSRWHRGLRNPGRGIFPEFFSRRKRG